MAQGRGTGRSGASASRARPTAHAVADNQPRAARKRSVSVRMYCHGLGDCFLLRFSRPSGKDSFNVLIDCGLIGVARDPKPLMRRVAQDIGRACGNRLDLVLVTHEHWDHVSGFSTEQAREVFDAFEIGEVWYGWCEDPGPANTLGQKLRSERAAKVRAVQRAAAAMSRLDDPLALDRARRLNDFLGFFGIDGSAGLSAADGSGGIGRTRAAFDYFTARRETTVRYRKPQEPPTAPTEVPGLRIYVLGPPEDERLLKRSDPTRSGHEVYELRQDAMLDASQVPAFARLLGDAAGARFDYPFDPRFVRERDAQQQPAALRALQMQTWEREPWRRIAYDWTSMTESLALDLDNDTNNTSLVVAFELGEDGPVLLFAADAQVGNWLSWQALRWQVDGPKGPRQVSGPDLLKRTVLYKVGHHGSHNATLRELGLEQMTSRDLVALVPVDEAQAQKNRWKEIPFTPLMQRLKEKTGGRVVRADSAAAPGAAELQALSARERKRFAQHLLRDPGAQPIYWEYKLEY